jgi:signal transduction histidine kinase
MSHELRTPLAIILGYTEMLLANTFGRLTDEQAEPLHRIDRSAQELLDLITAVLDLSRLEAGRLPLVTQETQLAELLHEIEAETQPLREQSRLTFAWDVEESLPTLYTDAGKLKVVLKNLIGNAVKFTTAGSIMMAVRRRQDGVEFRVTDTGMGIPQAALGVIFEPFHQLEPSATQQSGGTGLGLYIVKRLIEVLGGRVTVESEVGHGSTFRVWIPQGR